MNKVTSEGLYRLAVLNYYARIRIIQALIPLMQNALFLRRVITVGGGGFEGSIDREDFQGLKVPMENLKEHLTTLVSLGLESIAKTAPEISFVHDYPGTVKTPLLDHMPEEMMKTLQFIPLEECGERQVYLATSSRYLVGSLGTEPGQDVHTNGVPLTSGESVAVGLDEKPGSGVYSVGCECDSSSSEVLGKLAKLRQEGMADEVWAHTVRQFARIQESN